MFTTVTSVEYVQPQQDQDFRIWYEGCLFENSDLFIVYLYVEVPAFLFEDNGVYILPLEIS